MAHTIVRRWACPEIMHSLHKYLSEGIGKDVGCLAAPMNPQDRVLSCSLEDAGASGVLSCSLKDAGASGQVSH